MKTLKQTCGLVVMLFLIVLASCSDDDPIPETPKSSAKAITAFKFSALTPEVAATVSESDKTIAATVPNGTDRTKLVATVTVSEKATVTPASGATQDFTAPVKYTVTAEDGTKQEYTVTITEAAATFTVTRFSTTAPEQDGGLIVIGTDFGSYENIKVVLKNTSTGATVEIKASSTSTSTLLGFKVPADLPVGDYTGTIYVGTAHVDVPGKITVVAASAEVIAVDKTTVIPGEVITITGRNFKATGNTVKLSKSGKTQSLSIVAESTTEIQAKVPTSTDKADWTLVVNAGKDIFTSFTIKVVPDPNQPVVTNFDKYSYAIGQTITITGTGFKKAGVLTYLNFIPWPNGGATVIRNGVSNSDGTQITFTVDANFPAGNYDVYVEVDGLFSEAYSDIIQITTK